MDIRHVVAERPLALTWPYDGRKGVCPAPLLPPLALQSTEFFPSTTLLPSHVLSSDDGRQAQQMWATSTAFPEDLPH